MDCASSWSLPRLTGLPRAMALSMLGERLAAERAESWGMIWKCTDDDNLMDEAFDTARILSQMPTVALGIIKKQLRSSFSNTIDEQLELEASLQKTAGYTEDYYEGIRAFFEKRRPDFKGK